MKKFKRKTWHESLAKPIERLFFFIHKRRPHVFLGSTQLVRKNSRKSSSRRSGGCTQGRSEILRGS